MGAVRQSRTPGCPSRSFSGTSGAGEGRAEERREGWRERKGKGGGDEEGRGWQPGLVWKEGPLKCPGPRRASPEGWQRCPPHPRVILSKPLDDWGFSKVPSGPY